MEGTAQLRHTIVEPAQAEVSGLRPFGRQTDAIIGHRHDDALRIAADLDVHPRWTRVPYGVDDAFLDHAINGERDARAEIGR